MRGVSEPTLMASSVVHPTRAGARSSSRPSSSPSSRAAAGSSAAQKTRCTQRNTERPPRGVIARRQRSRKGRLSSGRKTGGAARPPTVPLSPWVPPHDSGRWTAGCWCHRQPRPWLLPGPDSDWECTLAAWAWCLALRRLLIRLRLAGIDLILWAPRRASDSEQASG